jgi:hypothetical protein
VPAQPVDATPSDMNSFLKVVFMAQGKRDRLSTEQRIDMWRRWKAGESLHEIDRAFGTGHGSILFPDATSAIKLVKEVAGCFFRIGVF